MYTDHLASLGGREIPRDDFLKRLAALAASGDRSAWSSDPLDPAR
jgi:leucyl/phenylalanyl-tRNA--protein transferase